MSISEPLRPLPYRLAPVDGDGESGRWLAAEVAARVGLLWRLALRYTGDESVAEQVVVRTVERAMNGASQVRSIPDTALWLVCLLRKTCLREHAGAVSGARMEPLRQPADTPYERLPELVVELRAELHEATLLTLIDALPFELREVLVLCELEGFGYDDAGRIMGLDPTTVRVRLRTARVVLERRVLRYLGGEGRMARRAAMTRTPSTVIRARRSRPGGCPEVHDGHERRNPHGSGDPSARRNTDRRASRKLGADEGRPVLDAGLNPLAKDLVLRLERILAGTP